MYQSKHTTQIKEVCVQTEDKKPCIITTVLHTVHLMLYVSLMLTNGQLLLPRENMCHFKYL